jgi:hypothetical protein
MGETDLLAMTTKHLHAQIMHNQQLKDHNRLYAWKWVCTPLIAVSSVGITKKIHYHNA